MCIRDRGDTVLAIGSPAGYRDSISVGMITSVSNTKNTLDNEYHLLTTDIMGDNEGRDVYKRQDGRSSHKIRVEISTYFHSYLFCFFKGEDKFSSHAFRTDHIDVLVVR